MVIPPPLPPFRKSVRCAWAAFCVEIWVVIFGSSSFLFSFLSFFIFASSSISTFSSGVSLSSSPGIRLLFQNVLFFSFLLSLPYSSFLLEIDLYLFSVPCPAFSILSLDLYLSLFPLHPVSLPLHLLSPLPLHPHAPPPPFGCCVDNPTPESFGLLCLKKEHTAKGGGGVFLEGGELSLYVFEFFP